MPRPPQNWTPEELAADAAASRTLFRERRRLRQQTKRQTIANDAPLYRDALVELLEATDDLRELATSPDALRTRSVLEMARFVPSPFISAGDLDTLTESCFGAWVQQTGDRGQVPSDDAFALAAEILSEEADPYRAPWLDAGRTPSDQEREEFIRATIALRFNSFFTAQRRSEGAKRQETAIRKALTDAGYAEVKLPKDLTDPIEQMPERTFSPAARNLRNTSVDVPIRLPNDHPTGLTFIALEAKDTNTEVNSRKRLLEVMQKAETWNRAGLPFQFRTAAVVSGSLPLDRLKEAQAAGVMIFWEHRLEDLDEFLAL